MSHNGLHQTESSESIDSDQKSDSIEKKRVHPDVPLDDEPDYVATENYSYNKKQSKKNDVSPMTERHALLSAKKNKSCGDLMSLLGYKLREHLLLVLTICGVILGIVVGIIMSVVGVSSKVVLLVGFPGELLLRMLKCLVLPLMSASIVVGISAFGKNPQQGNGKKEKRFLGYMLSYFIGTTVFAVILGLFVVSVYQPGLMVDPQPETPWDDIVTSNSTVPQTDTLDSILGVFESMFPENIIQAAANLEIMGIIVFSAALGGVLVSMGEAGKPLLQVFESLNECVMRLVMLVMWYAPFGILSLIAARLGEHSDFLAMLSRMGMFAATVITGLAVHGFIVLPFLYFFFLRKNPFRFYAGLTQAIVTALGTDSSSATMPVSIKCCNDFGISTQTTQLVIPLATTLNMNGTALYEAVAALFIAQLHGRNLDLGQMIIVALTSTLAAVGAAGIPEAGLITMTMVLTSVGLPLTDIGLILTIDWFLDRLRTVVNVLGDCVGAAILDKYNANKIEYTPIP